jgi:hypothetical protein
MDWQGSELKLLCANYRYYPGIRLNGLWKTTENHRQVSGIPGRDSNRTPPAYTLSQKRCRLIQLARHYDC